MLRIVAIVGTLFALAGGPVAADENSGLYLGAALGDFSSEFDDLEDVDIDFDEDSDAGKIFGGWRFNRFFAIQADYIDFGESDSTSGLLRIESDAAAIAPNVVGTLPLGPVEFFAKAGVLYYDLEVAIDGDELLDESSNDPFYGAGVGITLLERLALRAEYEVIDISEYADAEAFWISAAWRF